MGFFAVYCAGDLKAELATHLAQMPGVDLVVYSAGNAVAIEDSDGLVRLTWNSDASAFRYRAESSDPLQLSGILARLQADGLVDTDGWVSDADLFAATRHHRYPDPAFRLWQWATNHVRNQADLVVSLEPGWHQGSRTFERIVTMLSTHGSFDRSQSLGFAMSTDGPFHSGAIRSGTLLPDDLEKRKTRSAD
jgi:hypothetical protein